jgi:hypothetical protein
MVAAFVLRKVYQIGAHFRGYEALKHATRGYHCGSLWLKATKHSSYVV